MCTGVKIVTKLLLDNSDHEGSKAGNGMAEDSAPAQRILEVVLEKHAVKGTDQQRRAYVQFQGVRQRLDVGDGFESALSIPVLTWAAKLDERGSAFIVSALKSHKVEWNDTTGGFEVEGEHLDDDDLVWPITREFTNRWKELDVRIWYMNAPSPPHAMPDLSDCVCLEEYYHNDVWVEKHCVDVVQVILQRTLTDLRHKGNEAKGFMVKHKPTNTAVCVHALSAPHAFWKWATECSEGQFNPWDLVQECVDFCGHWMEVSGLDEIEDVSWAAQNDAKDLMDNFMQQIEKVVSIEAVHKHWCC